MKSERTAVVRIGDTPAGLLVQRGGQTSFHFLEEYLGTPRRPILGQAFEDNPRSTYRAAQGSVPMWFKNLLPESGQLRDWLSTSLGVDSEDEFAILLALGTDLPGAVTVEVSQKRAGASPWTREGLEEYGAPKPVGGMRFSVAGVQMKLSVLLGENTIRLAGRGELGDWLAKIPGLIPDVPLSEYHNLSLAAAVGLDVPELQLVKMSTLSGLPKEFLDDSDAYAFLIRRFDRMGPQRIHIEDLKQVLGGPPRDKYRGASAEGLGRVFLAVCGEDSFWEYLRRVFFNIVVGNEDAHLKNWSIIYLDGRTPSIAPLYDIVSTVVFPQFDRTHALRLGGSRRSEKYELRTLVRLAEKAGMSETRAREEIGRMAEHLQAVEPGYRQVSALPAEHWQRLDAYRQTVPLMSELGLLSHRR